MDILMEIFNEEEINEITSANEEVINLDNKDIENIINILKDNGCSSDIIRNIILSNPFVLSRYDKDVIRLINKLKNIGVNNINLVFDSYPNILNKDSYEINDFINIKLEEGLQLDEIADIIDSYPYMIDEV